MMDSASAQSPHFKECLGEEIELLNRRVKSEAPERGYAPKLGEKVLFRTLPISRLTLRGLCNTDEIEETNSSRNKKFRNSNKNSNKNRNNFVTMTEIQNACIPHALAGRDILGSAKTGSGKTLAFIIPILELLYRNNVNPDTGPSAIILSPTRELAMQIFDVLRSVGAHHHLSAFLLTGGKKEFHAEQIHVGSTNILVATPGRLLQHLEQTSGFDITYVQILVLDEADRLLDMGFRDELTRILEYLPRSRQTLLFSATQTKSVNDLAILSLNGKPEYLFIHDKPKFNSENDKGINTDEITRRELCVPTPKSLKQQYVMIVPLPHKLNTIYSFVKSHLRNKTIIFFSTCAQVRMVHALFCALQPGLPVLALHGKVPQKNRTKIYFEFCSKQNSVNNKVGSGAVLFATDLVARGLDFPQVDWVLQADAPEDKDAYIHRVGRTARNNADGKCLLLLLPSEEKGMLKVLKQVSIPLKKLSINAKKAIPITDKVASIVASNGKLNDLAKKAFKSYLKSMSLMPNKEIFRVDEKEMDVDGFANSLGLATTPSLKFLKRNGKNKSTRDEHRTIKNENKKLKRLKEEIKAERLQKKINCINTDLVSDSKKKKSNAKKSQENSNNEAGVISDSDDDSSDDGNLVLTKKQKNQWVDEGDQYKQMEVIHVDNKKRAKRIRIDGSSSSLNKRIKFNADGKECRDNFFQHPTDKSRCIKEEANLAIQNNSYVRSVRERLERNAELDAMQEKERIREKHQKHKKVKDNNAHCGVTLGDPEPKVFNEEFQDDSDSEDSDSNDTSIHVEAHEKLALSIIHGRKK